MLTLRAVSKRVAMSDQFQTCHTASQDPRGVGKVPANAISRGVGDLMAPIREGRRCWEDGLALVADQLIDEIDDLLEENAEEFVASYVQRGGE